MTDWLMEYKKDPCVSQERKKEADAWREARADNRLLANWLWRKRNQAIDNVLNRTIENIPNGKIGNAKSIFEVMK